MAGEKTLEEVMQFDPFSPSEGETEEEPVAQGQGGEKGQEGPAQDQDYEPQDPPSDGEESGDDDIPPQEEPSSQAPAQQAPQAQDLQAQIAALQAVLAQQRQQPQTQAQPQQQQPEAPKPPRFNLAIPPQLQQGMNSEDPAESGAAMHALVNGVANAIWKEFESTIQELEQKIMTQVPQVAQQQTQTIAEQQRVAQDFYGTYPQFNIPAMKPVVQQVAQGLAQQQAAMGMPVQWNAQFRDQVAAQLFQMFPMLQQGQGQGQGQRPAANGQAGAPRTAKPQKAQSFASGRGTRPQANTGDPQVNDILDTLDLR